MNLRYIYKRIIYKKKNFPITKELLGIDGLLTLAKLLLKSDDPFFVFNSDVIAEFSFLEMLDVIPVHMM